MTTENYSIGIVGLGYVGLPLAAAFSKKNNVIDVKGIIPNATWRL